MRITERFIMRLFSLVMLVISIGMLLLLFNVITVNNISYVVELIQSNATTLRVIVIINVVIMLMSFRGLFARLKQVDLSKNGIVLENGSGKLVISKESLENIISGVAKDIPGTESISSKTILDKNRNLRVYVNVVAKQDVYLKDLSVELQKRVKEAMLKTADLDVKEVDVRIKSISNKKNKKQEVRKVKEPTKETKTEEVIEQQEKENEE